MARANNFWFEFGGVSSVTNGLKLLALPNRPKPELRAGDPVIIPGRDGALWKTENSYNEFDLIVRAELLSTAVKSTINAWLNGRGVLRFSDATTRAYKARVLKQFDYEQKDGSTARKVIEITFRCQPCEYVYPIPQLTLANLTPITNPGTRYAEPVITIVGSGDIMLTIGTRTLTITGLASQITLDMEARVAYNGSTNLGSIVSGDWPLIVDPGVNAVLISGTVTSVTMVTNWRYI